MRDGVVPKHLAARKLTRPELPASLQGAWRWLYEGAPDLLHGGGRAKGPRDECGVFGIYGHPEAARLTYYGLYALQHRGQESAGIVTLNGGGKVHTAKGMGLVSEIFDDEKIAALPGQIALGHTRYSTTGSSTLTNAQPVVVSSKRGQLAIAHNGNLVDAMIRRDALENEGAIFSSTVDTEVIMHLVVRSKAETLEDAMTEALQQVSGGYALILLGEGKMIGVRDPHGIRPLSLGKVGDAWVLASESCAFDTVGAEYVRDIAPGEMVVVAGGSLRSRQALPQQGASRLCAFEYIYFARPDTNLQGVNVHAVRKEMGRILAHEDPIAADLVMGVPDSSISAATGYAEASGIPYEVGLIKNRYIGRTFISPNQHTRVEGVRLKLNPLRKVIEGKRVVLVDDSIVRGTTSRHLVSLLREAGAREVHMRISSPPYKNACHYGIDTSATKDLVATGRDVPAIRDYIGADSLHFLSLEGLQKAVGTAVAGSSGFCLACFNADYPVPIPEGADKFALEGKGSGC